jgi:hypothetical protein
MIGFPASLRLATVSAIIVPFSFLVSAEPLVWDFENDTAGGVPAADMLTVANENTDDGNKVLVADASTEPGDPTGVTGNKSVYIHRQQDATTQPMVQLSLPEALKAGTLTFDLYIPGTSTSGLAEVDLGTFKPNDPLSRLKSLAAVQFSTRSSGASDVSGVSHFSGSTSGTDVKTTHGRTILKEKNVVAITWSGTGTYSIKVNGELVVSDQFPDGNFPAANAQVGEVSAVRFTTASTKASPDYFFDNVSITQNP